MITPAEELEILVPDVDLEIAGETVTVHEYRFLEGMRVDAIAAPVIEGLRELFVDGDAAQVGMASLSAVFGEHPQVMTRLLAMATGKPESWVEGLSDADGLTLLMTWWQVNRNFFVRRLVMAMAARAANEPSDGVSASPG